MSGPWEKFQGAAPAADGPWAKFQAQPEGKSFGTQAMDFGKSFVQGSSIGEHLPLVGEAIADAGTSIGSGIVAATTTAPGEGYLDRLGQNYDQSMSASDAAQAERAAIDAESPAAGVTKNVLAGLAVAPMKAAPAKAAIDPFVKQGGFAQSIAKAEAQAAEEAAQLGKFSYPADTGREKLLQYLKEKAPAAGSAAMNMAKEGAEELLPYPARMMLRLSRKFGGKQ